MGDYVKNKGLSKGFNLIYWMKMSLGRVIIKKVLLYAMAVDQIIYCFGYIVFVSCMFRGFYYSLMPQNPLVTQERNTI